MNSSDKPWPPLIVAGHVPRLVKWRDLLLTSILWVCFALLLGIEFELFVGGSLGFLDIDWPLFYERLKPQKGIAYFVSGAAGQLRRGNMQPTDQTAAYFDQDQSFMLVEVVGNDLHFEVLSRTGKAVDSGVIHRATR